MATVTWDEMLPSLAPFLPGAPDITLRDALRFSAANFLGQTHLWREPFDSFSTTPDEPTYQVFSESLIEAVLWVVVESQEITHTDVRQVDKTRLDSVGRPKSFWVEADQALRLFPTPDDVYGVSGWAALKPSARSRGVEDWIAGTWQDAIVNGAIYRVAQIPNKGWSDMQLAQYHKQLHDRAIANARVRDVRGVRQNVKMRKV